MTRGLRREIELLLTFLLIAFIIGSLSGHLFIGLFIGLLLYSSWHFYNLYRLHKWLRRPTKFIPEAIGGWDEAFYQLYQLNKRHRRSRRKLASFLKRFQKSTQALPYATIVLNRANEIEWFNPAARQMFNLRSNIDVGQRIDNLIRQPEFIKYLAKRKFETPLTFPYVHQQILLNITPYGKGEYLLSARDVTLNSQLEEMRRNFISNASHELRTPITVIAGYVEVLLENEQASLATPLEKIQQQTQRMENIISELIELAKLETAGTIERSSLIDAETLLQDIYKEARDLDKGRHQIELLFEPVEILGSYDELRMAMSNLVTNAIRYTPDGGLIQIFSAANDFETCLGIKDKGIGIDQEHIPRLTERFYRVDEGRSRDAGGTGLGLSIVKHVLDRHGARLEIDSAVGEGSTFTCLFPAD